MAVATALGGDVLVIEVGGQPAITAVAVITLCRGRQVIQIFTHGGDAVMAARTSAQDLEVIDRDRRIPQVGRMAILANVGGADMVQALTGRSDAIVAITTGLRGDVLMIKVGG